MVRKKKVFRILLIISAILLIVVLINFIPVFSLKIPGMKVLTGNSLSLFYQTEEAAAKDVFALADEKALELTQRLGLSPGQKINIYVYDSQKTMQTKKYGYLALILGLDWYIGDNIGTSVLLTSPANPGKVHNYEDTKQAVLHEMVHAYISLINPDIKLWLTEGMALYLANGEPFYRDYLNNMNIPSYEDHRTNNPVKFSSVGGYTFSHTYIEYLETEYGWDKVMQLIKTQDYELVFGRTDKAIYEEWVGFLKNYYQ